ncbi:MAG: hypothetical protein Q8885_01670, partial [Candidatus Phytoplasma stylosanthis]|nr:hypothetical protein [Candidatus Phytoplasma stylosanthis]
SEKVFITFSDPLQNYFPIFQINYQNNQKEEVKKVIGKINIPKLETLKLFQLNQQKKDKYGRPLKTNYKKGLNILYYRLEDLKYINFFLTKAKQGYRVKKIHPMYKYISKNK